MEPMDHPDALGVGVSSSDSSPLSSAGAKGSISHHNSRVPHSHKNTKIVACDTFRSGAVEQLKTHARNLNVPLFERGYEKDPAGVAMNGIHDGKEWFFLKKKIPFKL